MLVHSQTEEENIVQLEQVLKILRKNNLKIRASKTELLMQKIKFCGYILEDGHKKPNPDKVEIFLSKIKPGKNDLLAALRGELADYETGELVYNEKW